MKKNILHTLLTIFVFITVSVSCVTNYNGDFPTVSSLPVLNAVICNDSLLSASMSWSMLPENNDSPPALINANVSLYVNGMFKSELQSKEDGSYHLPSNVTLFKDSLYTLRASGPDFEPIMGSTIIPQMPVIKLSEIDTGCKLNIKDTTSTYSALWIYVYMVDSTNAIIKPNSDPTLFGDGRLADDFNRSIDAGATMSGGSFIYVYEKCIRIDRQSLVNGVGEMTFNASGIYGPVNVYIIAASPEYDKYCKGAFMQEIQSLNLELPFTYQNVTVPSNISNGIGLFGGYSVKAYRFN